MYLPASALDGHIGVAAKAAKRQSGGVGCCGGVHLYINASRGESRQRSDNGQVEEPGRVRQRGSANEMG